MDVLRAEEGDEMTSVDYRYRDKERRERKEGEKGGRQRGERVS